MLWLEMVRFLLKVMGIGVLSAAGAAPAAERGPNVLFIAVDDLRPELGCYGADYAQSPNIDRLAASGMRFANHYVAVPTCGASRFALLTGRSPARSGVTANNQALYEGATKLVADELPGAQSLPELFRRSGYRTVLDGKISHTADGRVYAYDGSGDGRPEMPHAWDEYATPLGAWKNGWGIFFAYPEGVGREDGSGHQDLMDFSVVDDTDLPEGLLAQTAVARLESFAESEEPFFIGLGFFKPHLPWVAPRQDWEAFADVEIPPVADPEKPDSPFWPSSGEFYRYDAPYEKTRPLEPEAARQARRAYLACVRYMDRQVGKVLDALDRTGLAENTVVVLWGDHGWHLGEQQVWGKHAPFERALRSPLIVRAPGVTGGGTVCPTPVETIDLYPTLVELCAPSFAETAFPLDGNSLVPALRGETPDGDAVAVSYWRGAVTARSERYRLVGETKGGEVVDPQLYDLSEDADSMTDVAAENPEVVARLVGEIGSRRSGP